jgi:hypothetical protein
MSLPTADSAQVEVTPLVYGSWPFEERRVSRDRGDPALRQSDLRCKPDSTGSVETQLSFNFLACDLFGRNILSGFRIPKRLAPDRLRGM